MPGRNKGPSLLSSRWTDARPLALSLVIAALGCGGAPPEPPRPPPVAAHTPPEAPKVQLEKRFGTRWFRHGESIRSVAVTKDGTTVLSCGEKSIVAFDASSGAERQRTSTSCMRLAMSPDASRVAVIGEEEISLYPVTGHGLAPKPSWTAPVPKVFYQIQFRELAFAPDGRTLGVRIGFEDFRTFSVETGKLLQSRGFKAGYPDNDFVVLGPCVDQRCGAPPQDLFIRWDRGAALPGSGDALHRRQLRANRPLPRPGEAGCRVRSRVRSGFLFHRRPGLLSQQRSCAAQTR